MTGLARQAAPGAPAVFAANRAQGGVRFSVAADDRGRTRREDVAENGSLRVRFPNSGRDAEAVLVNTAGGIAGGDRFAVGVEVGEEARLTVTSAAAEKVYRSLGPAATVEVEIAVAAGGSLAWLPQETIFFDGAVYARTIAIDLAARARLVFAEATVLGRAAHGEQVRAGQIVDRWRVRRDGKLIYADGLRLEQDIAAQLEAPAAADGAAALATVLIAPGSDDIVTAIRALEGLRGEAGISAWNGIAVARLIAADGATLRQDLARVIAAAGAALPRLWLS